MKTDNSIRNITETEREVKLHQYRTEIGGEADSDAESTPPRRINLTGEQHKL